MPNETNFSEVLSMHENSSKNTCSFTKYQDFNIVYFDLETTGLDSTAFILQIAAKYENNIFDVYVKSKKDITDNASEATGLLKINGELYFQDKVFETLKINQALHCFRNFLISLSPDKKVLLVAHNAKFDSPRLLQAFINNNMLLDFEIIFGFSDTLPLFIKKNFLTEKVLVSLNSKN